MNRKIIGITGGLGTGKSAVSNYLQKQYNLMVLDADLYAREATENDSDILDKIINRYGQDILLESGQLDRSKLANIIFNQIQERQWLEHLIHPYVKKRFAQDLQISSEEIIIFVVPLLFEAQMQDMVDEIWLVTCGYEQQIQRVSKRNNLSQQEAMQRINTQWDLDTKRNLADIVINNTQNLDYLYEQINKAIEQSEIYKFL